MHLNACQENKHLKLDFFCIYGVNYIELLVLCEAFRKCMVVAFDQSNEEIANGHVRYTATMHSKMPTNGLNNIFHAPFITRGIGSMGAMGVWVPINISYLIYLEP